MISLPRNEELYWVAGLLEGEGWFTLVSKHYPMIGVKMTDRDVIMKASNILSSGMLCMNPALGINSQGLNSFKDQYYIHVTGKKAIEWMLLLYPIMGERRQARIKEVLKVWNDRPRTWTHKSLHALKAQVSELVQ